MMRIQLRRLLAGRTPTPSQKRPTVLETPSAVPMSDGFARRIGDQLLGGAQSEEIVSHWARHGLLAHDVRVTIAALEHSPLMPTARRLAMLLGCRDWLYKEYARLEAHREVAPKVRGLCREAFLTGYYWANRPVVIPGFAERWPALTKWTDAYLKEQCGAAEVLVMMNRLGASAKDQYSGNHLSRRLRFDDFVDLVSSAGKTNDYYLVAKNNFFSAPETRAMTLDVGPDDLEVSGSQMRDLRLWFGPSGTHTPLHYDSRSSLLVQVRGRKRMRLVPPWYATRMRQEEPWYAGDVSEAALEGEGDEHLRDARFVLEPSDAVFIPVGWWHEVEALDVSISVTILNLAA